MKEIFLSASVPLPNRGHYFETADPFLIQIAVRELIAAVIQTYRVVWGGHPAITPMVWTVCQDLGVQYTHAVTLYQSRFFEEQYPEENEQFQNTVFVEAVKGDREASLFEMRRAMLARPELVGAVIIGGMDGTESEHTMFRELHPRATVLAMAATGGAAADIASVYYRRGARIPENEVDFAHQYRQAFPPL